MSILHTKGPVGEPVGLCNVRFAKASGSSDSAYFDYVTEPVSGNQTFPLPNMDPVPHRLWANVPIVNGGKNDWYQPRYLEAFVDVSPRPDGSWGDVEIALPRAPIVGEADGPLHIEGRDFKTPSGAFWQFRGYSIHYLPNCVAGGYACDPFDAVLDQVIDYGYNTLVTIGLHASPWKYANGWAFNPLTHPNYYQIIEAMFDRAEDRRVFLAHAILADVQHYAGDPHDLFRRTCEIARGRKYVLLRKGNEDLSNGWHPNNYPFPTDMGDVLLSQGSRGEGTNPSRDPFFPYLDWVEYEVIRKFPKAFLDLPLRQMMDGDFAGPATNRPTVNIEPMFFADTDPDHVGDRRSTDIRVAREMGLMMAACAGGAFGCSLGLECRVLPSGSLSDQCARAFIEALVAGFKRPLAALDFQGDH